MATYVLVAETNKNYKDGADINKNGNIMIKKQLRKSQYNDYVAVDEVSENKILATPIYLLKGKVSILKSKDMEEEKWFKTEVIFNGRSLSCRDIDPDSPNKGLTWESDLSELLEVFKELYRNF